MKSRNIEIVLSNPIASQLRYLGYGATPSGLKTARNSRDNRLQCRVLLADHFDNKIKMVHAHAGSELLAG